MITMTDNNILKTDFFPDINNPERESTKFKDGCFCGEPYVTEQYYYGRVWEFGILKAMKVRHGSIGHGGVFV